MKPFPVFLFSALFAVQAAAQTAVTPFIAKYGDVPLVFEENRGQADGRAKYLLRGRNLNLFVTTAGAVLTLRKGGAQAAIRMEFTGAKAPGDVRMRLAGAEETTLMANGDLRIQTAAGDLIQQKPRMATIGNPAEDDPGPV